jgi:hypothetical protein
MQHFRRRLRYTWAASVVLGLVVLLNGGCLWVAAGAAGGGAVALAYYKGKVCALYNAGFGDVWSATQTALHELGMPILKAEREDACGFIVSRTADNEQVRIDLNTEPSRIPADRQVTRVSVRVAVFGDHPASFRVLDQVALHLTPARDSPSSPSSAALGPIQPLAPMPSPAAPAALPPQTAPPPLLPPDQIRNP